MENRLAQDGPRPKSRGLASKFSAFTGVLLSWVVLTTICWDLIQHTFSLAKGLVLCGLMAAIATAISRFTNRVLARPLKLLEAGIRSVGEGHPEPIQVSRTGDEIEWLGEGFNLAGAGAFQPPRGGGGRRSCRRCGTRIWK